MTHADDLRAWARGSYTTEAATELLLKAFGGRFAEVGNPWVHAATTSEEGYREHAWIDFAAIQEEAGPLSGGERRFLMLAASLAAIAHAGGSHQHSDIRFNEDGTMSRGKGHLDSLHPWPLASRAV
ncbi:hypothetical protein FBY31_4406 [Arthrobacter sp. SLBN-100]|uniref:hypothetical protein n=1 Tax=Arthrobacter sp. SLBN-100 TaxID=2768450 RepID=UPI00114D5E9F|nr:hypothetical protein [Arthrobacter sp. SLBN-100]TQJ62030.1 hypothetical protein FBY31_4406 [Arthrobacter sp. SLBN-100]